jgi:nicotinamidase-related amidase
MMASLPVRDPVGGHLLTPQNAAMLVIDYQPGQFAAVSSMNRNLLLENIVSTVKIAKLFGLPIVQSTINIASGRGQPTVPELAELLEDNPPIDWTSINAWEDADFLSAVRATGRIINPKTARSQLVGGMTWGLSMALHEERVLDRASATMSTTTSRSTTSPATPMWAGLRSPSSTRTIRTSTRWA